MLIVGADKNFSDVKYSQKDCVHMSGAYCERGEEWTGAVTLMGLQ